MATWLESGAIGLHELASGDVAGVVVGGAAAAGAAFAAVVAARDDDDW